MAIHASFITPPFIASFMFHLSPSALVIAHVTPHVLIMSLLSCLHRLLLHSKVLVNGIVLVYGPASSTSFASFIS